MRGDLLANPVRLVAAGLVIAVLGVTVVATPASWAHGGLAVSTPANGGTLDAPADTVTLAFTEKPAPFAYFTVTTPTGERVDRPWSHGEPVRLAEPMREYQLVGGVWQPQEFHMGFPVKVPVAFWPHQGQYVVRYQSVASDGEPVKGEVRFTYTGAMTPAPAGWQSPTDQPSRQLLAATGHPQQAPPTAGTVTETAAPSGPDRTWLWLAPVLLILATTIVIAVISSRKTTPDRSGQGKAKSPHRPTDRRSGRRKTTSRR